MADLTPTGLRVLLVVAERGSFTAAAARLGYTQSAVSRQIATLETAAGQQLFERHRGGVRLTAAGSRMLPRARRIVDELDAALADAQATPSGRVRVGMFPMAAATLLPAVLTHLRTVHPELIVTMREATTPALVRAVRAGTLDLTIVTQAPPYRPLDSESPAFYVSTLVERDLVVAVGPNHPLAQRRSVEIDELAGQIWVASMSEGADSRMGVWPGLAERADTRYVVRDWLTKLELVAAGHAITTLAAPLAGLLPGGVRTVSVRGEPRETRRMSLLRLPGRTQPAATTVAAALRTCAQMN